jgi:hypothetical protein
MNISRGFPLLAHLAVLAAVLAAGLTAGCAGRMGSDGLSQDGVPAGERLVQAREAYLAGEYERAGTLFQTLTGNRTDPALARRAAFGLACARLAGAETDQEAAAALSLWREWLAAAPRAWPEEDQTMLLALLSRLGGPGPGRGGETSPGAGLAPVDGRPLPGQNRTSARGRQASARPDDLGSLRHQLREKVRESEKLAAQLKDKGQENERLRRQLNALEKLHQEMSAKMKSLE